MLNGNCSAQNPIAADYPTNSTYASGWSAGQNGGFGFGPWSMSNTGTNLIQNAVDHTSPYNPFGVAWTLYNPVAPAIGCPNPPDTGGPPNPPNGDISRVGRSCPPLLPGQTFSTIIANPLERRFFRGYTLRLVTGSDNTMYGNAGTQIAIGTFEYFTYGRWYTTESYQTGRTPLFDTNTTTNGMQIDITMTTSNSYHLVMTPVGNPAIAYSEDGALLTNSPVNWIEYEMYNTDSDFYPTLASGCQARTDFYIKSMTISGIVLNIQKLDPINVLLTWQTNVPSFSLESTTNLGAAAAWNPVSPPPSIVNGQNAVTNPIAANQQFYRLRFTQ